MFKNDILVLYRKRYLLFILGPKRRLFDVYILSKVLLTYSKEKVLIKFFFSCGNHVSESVLESFEHV